MDQEILNSYSKLNDLNVSRETFLDFENYISMIIEKNQKINIISQNTSSKKSIIERHIIDSAQIIDFVDFNSNTTTDLGSGGGFPGIVIAIFNENRDFHVKLYEKSPVKRKFLNKIINNLKIDAEVYGNIYENNIEADFIVCRAFKKMEIIIQVSRETAKKSHKLIILKGKSAQEEINNSLIIKKYRYKLEKSLTSGESKIILVDVNK